VYVTYVPKTSTTADPSQHSLNNTLVAQFLSTRGGTMVSICKALPHTVHGVHHLHFSLSTVTKIIKEVYNIDVRCKKHGREVSGPFSVVKSGF
jgi:hypothetical protein